MVTAPTIPHRFDPLTARSSRALGETMPDPEAWLEGPDDAATEAARARILCVQRPYLPRRERRSMSHGRLIAWALIAAVCVALLAAL